MRSPPPASTSCPHAAPSLRSATSSMSISAQLEWMPTASRADLALRRQVRLGDRHRVPRAQGQPALRHHALAASPVTRPGRRSASRCAEAHDEEQVVIAAAVTNGSSTTEQFHFYDEMDSNAGKTASGRLSVRPLLPHRPRGRPLRRVRRAGPRARQPRSDLVLGSGPARPHWNVDLKGQ